MDNLHGVEQFAQPFQGEVFTLDRHHDAVRSREGVQGEQAQTRGAVQHNEVVVVANRFKGLTQFAFPLVGVDQFNLGTHQVEVGGEHVKVGGRGRDNAVAQRRVARNHLVASLNDLSGVNAHTARCVCLRVEVHEEGLVFQHPQASPQIDGRGGLSNPTFLVRYSNDFSHGTRSLRGLNEGRAEMGWRGVELCTGPPPFIKDSEVVEGDVFLAVGVVLVG